MSPPALAGAATYIMTTEQIIIRIIEISLCLYLVRRINSWWGKKSMIDKVIPSESKSEPSKKGLNLIYNFVKKNRKTYATKENLKININRATDSRELFFYFIKKCNELFRSGHDLNYYRKLIYMHRNQGKLQTLIEEEAFIKLIYATLEKFNMNQKGARMVALDDFKASIRSWKNNLVNLYEYKLFELSNIDIIKIKEDLEKVFINLNIMESNRRIVGVSKTLHFLLPDLIMPIDGKYTLPAFFGRNKFAKTPQKEFMDFWYIFNESIDITERLELASSDVDGVKWNTSVPKLIDNAIIGLYKSQEKNRRLKPAPT